MNKKGTEMTIGSIVIIILALLFLVFLIWGVTTDWDFENEPKFKITKEECKLGVQLQYNCDNGKVILPLNDEGYDAVLIEKNITCWKYMKEIKVCEQVEVDEIQDPFSPDIDCENYWCWSISKEKLTIKWLDENCECNNPLINSDGSITFSKDTYEPGESIVIESECSNYKCQDYIIELETAP